MSEAEQRPAEESEKREWDLPPLGEHHGADGDDDPPAAPMADIEDGRRPEPDEAAHAPAARPSPDESERRDWDVP